MTNKIISNMQEKVANLYDKWKYLLLQEKCRLCMRMIHPLIENMDFDHYGPPARYFINDREIVSDVLCQLCAVTLASNQAIINGHQFHDLDNKRKTREFLLASRAAFREPINTLIYKLKYSDDVLLAKDLACLMYRAWQLLKYEIDEEDDVDSLCIVPVPLHKKRLHERGFNQAELLAMYLGKFLQIKLETKLLRRIKNTASQQELSKAERAVNVAAAFKAAAEDAFIGRRVIIVDDVCTSGATLIECSKAITAAGASAVYGFSVAFVP
jgi:ComF family protein